MKYRVGVFMKCKGFSSKKKRPVPVQGSAACFEHGFRFIVYKYKHCSFIECALCECQLSCSVIPNNYLLIL